MNRISTLLMTLCALVMFFMAFMPGSPAFFPQLSIGCGFATLGFAALRAWIE